MFSLYLGNVPADVVLEDVWINGKQLMMSASTEQSYSITPVLHANGSRAYALQLPFEDGVVSWTVRTLLGPGDWTHLGLIGPTLGPG